MHSYVVWFPRLREARTHLRRSGAGSLVTLLTLPQNPPPKGVFGTPETVRTPLPAGQHTTLRIACSWEIACP